MLLYITLTLAALTTYIVGIALHQRRTIKRLNALLSSQAALHCIREKAAYRRGWNKALAKAYPYGIIPERVRCPEEDIKIAAT